MRARSDLKLVSDLSDSDWSETQLKIWMVLLITRVSQHPQIGFGAPFQKRAGPDRDSTPFLNGKPPKFDLGHPPTSKERRVQIAPISTLGKEPLNSNLGPPSAEEGGPELDPLSLGKDTLNPHRDLLFCLGNHPKCYLGMRSLARSAP